jgi:hypothetical protein
VKAAAFVTARLPERVARCPASRRKPFWRRERMRPRSRNLFVPTARRALRTAQLSMLPAPCSCGAQLKLHGRPPHQSNESFRKGPSATWLLLWPETRPSSARTRCLSGPGLVPISVKRTWADPTRSAGGPLLKKFVAFLSQIVPIVPVFPTQPVRKCCAVYNLGWHGRGHRFDPDQVHQSFR